MPGAVQALAPGVDADVAWAAPARPDSVVVLQADGGSGVLCLEIDEATEHAPQIRAKLADYERGLAGRLGWHVVFVVPTEHRLAWMRRVVRGDRATVAGHVWATTFADLEHAGLDAPVVPVGGAGERQPLRSLLDEPRPRRCPTPVASPAWVELLGSGGGEDLDEALR